MDARRFDALTRALSALGSRRAVLRSLAGSGLGLAVGSLATQDADAKRGGRKRRKRRRKGCGCSATQICVNPASKTCVTGTGTCKAGVSACGGQGEPADFQCATSPDLIGDQQCSCIESADGKTRCAREALLGDGCAQEACDDDADCAERFPAVTGAFCAKSGNCCANKQICVAPCSNADLLNP